eukprot:7248658-Alexandrium_andersonii.AAC.1
MILIPGPTFEKGCGWPGSSGATSHGSEQPHARRTSDQSWLVGANAQAEEATVTARPTGRTAPIGRQR